MKKIVIVIVGQPSTNPRSVKEAIALSDAGYSVTILYNFWVFWAEEEDRLLKEKFPQIKFIRTGGHPSTQKLYYLFTRLRNKLSRKMALLFPKSLFWQQLAVMRSFPELKNAARANKADLYIAHNLGALPAAASAAKKNKAGYAFDAEDFHRGQSAENGTEWNRTAVIENAYLPETVFCTAASPLIADKYKSIYPGLDPVVLNNVFSKKYLQQVQPYSKGQPLLLFWFSQTVGAGRGLSEMIQAMGFLKSIPVQCTIVGSCTREMKNTLLEAASDAGVQPGKLIFNEPVSTEQLFTLAAQHHIGLALEQGTTVNNNIALSNKLFTYLSAGLAIAASATDAQKQFIENNPAAGKLCKLNDARSLANIIQQWCDAPDELNAARTNALQLATEKYNWEEEQKMFLQTVHNSFQS